MDQSICPQCGAAFYARREFCSDRCRNIGTWARRPRVPCVSCGEPTGYVVGARATPESPRCRPCMIPDHGSTRRYRKYKCRCELCRAANAEQARKYAESRKARGKPIVRKGRVYSPRRPCVGCGTSTRSIQSEPRCKPCGYAFRRMVLVPRSVRRAIYERDRWTCGVCGEPVEDGLPSSSPWQATLDHIVPRAFGGSDDPKNLRLAHRWCNSIRSTSSELTIEGLAS